MHKKISFLILSIALIITAVITESDVFSSNSSTEKSAITVSIDDQDIQYTEETGYPFIDENCGLLMPFRSTMEAFGCKVSWDAVSNTAVAEKGDITVRIPIGQSFIYKNGEKIINEGMAILKEYRTYLPMKVVLEAFGTMVNWNEAAQTVDVADQKSDLIKIHFIDVGQGDSIFIDAGTYEILIDGGRNEEGSRVVDYIKPYVDGNLELIVATHGHIDHIGGLDRVIEAFQVNSIIYSDEDIPTASFRDFYNAAKNEPSCNFTGDNDMSLTIGNGATFNILEMGDGYPYPNENSVVSMLTYKDIDVLFMGDLETTVEIEHLDKFKDVDVLKVGHHGSRTASSQEFLEVVRPEVSIISAGRNNEFLQPNADVLSRLTDLESIIYGTFRSGDIIMTTDGSTYNFNTDIRLTLKDAGAGTVIDKETAYIGNIRTKKFHTLTCVAGSKISDRNVTYFKTKEEAMTQGYEPCKLCGLLDLRN